MKKILSVIMAVAMIASVFACFGLSSSAATEADKTIYSVKKVSSAPTLDGKVDSSYGNPIASMQGKDMIDESRTGGVDERFPVGFNSEATRYDKKDHEKREDADWYNAKLSVYASYDDTYLYLLVDVKNGGELNDNTMADWMGDCIQVAISTYGVSGTNANGATDYSIGKKGSGLAVTANLTDSIPAKDRRQAYGPTKTPIGNVFDFGNGSYAYELALEWKALGVGPANGIDTFGFNVSLNMNDKNMDKNAFCGMQITHGIFNNTDTAKAGMAYAAKMNLVGMNPEPNPEPNPNPNPEPNPDPNPNPNPEPNPNPGPVSEVRTSAQAKFDENKERADEILNNKDKYTEDTVTAFETAYNEFSAVLGNDAAKDEDITAAQTKFEEALAAVKEVENSNDSEVKTAAQAKFDENKVKADEILQNKDNYTEETVTAFETAYNEFSAVLENDAATDEEITAAQTKFEEALAAVKEVEEPKDEDNKKPDDKQPEESGSSLLWLWIVIGVVVVLAVAAVCVYFFVLKKDLSKLKTLFSKK